MKTLVLPLVASLALLPVAASAVPIVYTYAGTGTGSLGGVGFTNANFVITANADTQNVAPWINAGGGPQNTHLSTTVSITGVGAATITTPAHTWLAQNCCGGLGENLNLNWITIDVPGFTGVGYGLNTNFGPVTDNSPDTAGQFVNIATTAGGLTFSSISTVTFSAVTTVPEPTTALLWALGLSGLALGARRRA